MARDTSLGYIVANKFSMDPDKRQKIFSQCKKEDNSLEQRKQEILFPVTLRSDCSIFCPKVIDD